MSKTNILLIASLALNAFLAVTVVGLMNPRGAFSSPDPVAAVAPAMASLDTVSTVGELGAAPKADASRTEPRRAQGADALDDLVAELRRRGIDESVVRTLAVAEAEWRFARDARELMSSGRSRDYWDAGGERGPVRGEKLEAFQRLRQEKRNAIARLFGEEYADTLATQTANAFSYANATFTHFDYLPADKRLQVIEYLENSTGTTDRSANRIAARLGRNPLADELKKEQDIRLLLGPALFDEYVKRSSGTSQNLREELAAFRPSRAEFDAILAVERDFDARTSDLVGFQLDARSGTKVQAAQEQKREAIRNALGDTRFADYERATDWSFRHLDMLARDMGLDASVARSGYSRVEQARSRSEALLRGREMADPNVQREVEAVSRDLQARLAEDFGLTDSSEQETQALLGPAVQVWPQRGWATRRGNLTTR